MTKINTETNTVTISTITKDQLIERCEKKHGGKSEFKMSADGYQDFLNDFSEFIDDQLRREVDHYDTQHTRFIDDWVSECSSEHNII